MEALVYIFTYWYFNRNFLCRIFQRSTSILKIKPFIWFYFFNPHVLRTDHANFRSGSKSCIDRICGNSKSKLDTKLRLLFPCYMLSKLN
jgi:hypothetical protein